MTNYALPPEGADESVGLIGRVGDSLSGLSWWQKLAVPVLVVFAVGVFGSFVMPKSKTDQAIVSSSEDAVAMLSSHASSEDEEAYVASSIDESSYVENESLASGDSESETLENTGIDTQGIEPENEYVSESLDDENASDETVDESTEEASLEESVSSEEEVVAQPEEGLAQTDESNAEPVEDSSENMVYVTPTGSKYHQQGCRTLKDEIMAMSLDDAVSQGYEACGVCGG